MSRLFDKVRASVDKDWLYYRAFEEAVVIMAGNISEYCNIAEKWGVARLTDDSVRSLHCVTPPFPVTWVEFPSQGAGIVGWLLIRADVATGKVMNEQPFKPNELRKAIDKHYGIEARWYIRGFMFMSSPTHIPHAEGNFLVDNEGHLLEFEPQNKSRTLNEIIFTSNGKFRDVEMAYRDGRIDSRNAMLQTSIGLVMYTLRICMWVFAFMHVKNAVIEDVEPEAAPSKKHERRYGSPLTRYKILKIKQMGKRSSEGKGGHHAPPAIHIAAGHFKTFSEEAPLFGRAVGTYWWNEQIRGNPVHGKVNKDYDVYAGETDPTHIVD